MDKPAGPTSHDVVTVVRRATGTRRVGHTGTLDPFAEGLLVVLVGRATRLAAFLLGLPKQYTGVLRLGVRTDTDDLEGVVRETSDAWTELTDARIDKAMASLTGAVEQVPPPYSAKKVRGQPAHRRVRRGETVALEPRLVQVERFQRTSRSGRDVAFAAAVGSGTYVRALARDLGERLGCGAHLIGLRRTRVGPFPVEEAAPLASVSAGTATLRPALDAVAHLPVISLGPEAGDAVRHGRSVPAPEDALGPVALVSEGELLAIAEPGDGRWRPRVVLSAS